MLFEAIRQTKCGIGAFELLEADSETTIILRGTQMEFCAKPYGSTYDSYFISYTSYGVGYPLIKGGQPLDFKYVLVEFKTWLKSHAQPCFEDHNSVDLWGEYKSGAEYINFQDMDTNDTDFFSDNDRGLLKFAMEDLKVLIPKKFKVTPEQLAIVNEKLDYLVDSSTRVSKTDWKSISIGIISSIIIALSLDTEKGNQLWELFMQVLRSIPLLPGI